MGLLSLIFFLFSVEVCIYVRYEVPNLAIDKDSRLLRQSTLQTGKYYERAETDDCLQSRP